MNEPASTFTEQELDFLKEAGNIAAGHAASALSELLHRPVDMQIPHAELAEFSALEAKWGEEEAAWAVSFQVNGGPGGYLYIMFSEDDAKELLSGLFSESSLPQHRSIEQSAFSETGNIMAGTYLSVLSEVLRVKLTPTPPAMMVDMAQTILNDALLTLAYESDEVLMIDTILTDKKTGARFKGWFVYLADPVGLKRFISEFKG